jgi:hypothetical protein
MEKNCDGAASAPNEENIWVSFQEPLAPKITITYANLSQYVVTYA